MSEQSLQTGVATVGELLQLQKFLVDFRNVPRMLPIPETEVAENDVEHSFFLAVIAWQLAEKIDPSLDQLKIVKYALVHDLVEAYAGDAFAFDAIHQAEKVQKEDAALRRIDSEFSRSFPSLVETIKEYEAKQDRESLFVYALDKIMPTLLSCLDGGRAWKEHGITFGELIAYDKPKVEKSPGLIEIHDQLLDYLSDHPEFFEA